MGSCGIRACDLAGRRAALEAPLPRFPRRVARGGRLQSTGMPGGEGWRNAAADSEPNPAVARRQLPCSRPPSSESRRPSGAENPPVKSSGGLFFFLIGQV